MILTGFTALLYLSLAVLRCSSKVAGKTRKPIKEFRDLLVSNLAGAGQDPEYRIPDDNEAFDVYRLRIVASRFGLAVRGCSFQKGSKIACVMMTTLESSYNITVLPSDSRFSAGFVSSTSKVTFDVTYKLSAETVKIQATTSPGRYEDTSVRLSHRPDPGSEFHDAVSKYFYGNSFDRLIRDIVTVTVHQFNNWKDV